MSQEIEAKIRAFSREVGTGTSQKGNELVFKFCPYCSGGSNRDKNTFSINTITGQFQCKRSSCSRQGNLITLAEDFNFDLGDEYNRRYNINGYNNRFKKFKVRTIATTDPAIAYLKSRGISQSTADKYHITTKAGADNILVFPFYDDKGELKFIKYRNTAYVKGETKGSKEWCESNCMPILFGMDHCDLNQNTTLIMTEGQIDSLSVAECGFPNAVSVPTGMNGFTWFPHCAEWIDRFEELIIFGDCEHGKVTLAENMQQRFKGKFRVVRVEDYQGCKDANELLQKFGPAAIGKAISQAAVLPDTRIVDLGEVRPLDMEKMFKVPTMIRSLDRIASGGLYGGQVIALTGKAGDGKSTFLSQMLLNFIEQGYNTFCYSGELSVQMFQYWLNRQAAGTAKLTEGGMDLIRSWYKGKVYIYDYTRVSENDEMETLLELTEKAIRDLDCKIVMLDNLMTAVSATTSAELYERQKDFVGRLTKLATLYDVVIILVAHPKKIERGSQISESYDIAGSSDIGNKVSMTLAYCRMDPRDGGPDQRELKILKNRLTGWVTTKERRIVLNYDEASRRIYETAEDLRRAYGWKRDKDGFVPLEEELPFLEGEE